jgi:uncharacterized protein YgbK (DUF1537 family)
MGDVESIEDLLGWTRYFSPDTLFAGASGFFNSILSHLKVTKTRQLTKNVPFGNKRLFVLGSSYPKNSEVLMDMVENGHFHSNMPGSVFFNTTQAAEDLGKWVQGITDAFKSNSQVIISSIHISENDSDIFKRIKKQMAWVVKEVYRSVEIEEILIEGGSTTYEILKQLNIKQLSPIQELEFGVIRMQVKSNPKLCITTKPGSYQWPEKVWKKNRVEEMKNSYFKQSTVNE